MGHVARNADCGGSPPPPPGSSPRAAGRAGVFCMAAHWFRRSPQSIVYGREATRNFLVRRGCRQFAPRWLAAGCLVTPDSTSGSRAATLFRRLHEYSVPTFDRLGVDRRAPPARRSPFLSARLLLPASAAPSGRCGHEPSCPRRSRRPRPRRALDSRRHGDEVARRLEILRVADAPPPPPR